MGGPIQASCAFEGCVLETQSLGTLTGYISRLTPSHVTTQIIANSYIDNVANQPFGTEVRLLGCYLDQQVTSFQFLNCSLEIKSCWFIDVLNTALELDTSSRGRLESCRFENCGIGLSVATASVFLANNSLFTNCITFVRCGSCSSLRMRRNIFTTSLGIGIDYREGSKGDIINYALSETEDVGLMISEVANVSLEFGSITSSASHAVHVRTGGKLYIGFMTIDGSGGDAIRLEEGSSVSGRDFIDTGQGAAGEGFHLIHLAFKSTVSSNVVPGANLITPGNDYRVGSLETKTKAQVSSGEPTDVNDAFVLLDL